MPAAKKLHFYGVTLTKDKNTVKWEQEPNIKLHIKQILLGHDSAPGEYNVVELELESVKTAKPNAKQTVAVLKLGETQNSLADIEICRGYANFKLVSGSGPVHIMGLQFPELTAEVGREYGEEEYFDEHGDDMSDEGDDDEVEDEEDDEEDEAPPPPPVAAATKKNKGSGDGKKK